MKQEFQHFIELLYEMTKKELLARYKHTVFGFLWLIINPILQMLVIGFIFQFFIKHPIPYYFHHLFIGLLVWNFFSLSLTKATPSIVFERSLIKKAYFPREVIPLSIIFSNFIHLLIAFFLFLLSIVFIGKLSFFGVFIGACSFVLLLLFTAGLSLLTSSLNVRFRDVSFFVQAILIVWFYATPIVYSLELIPRDLLWLWRLNPMTSILQLLQYSFVDGAPPGPAMLTANTTMIFFIVILGIVVFRRESRFFDDWV
ncbi:MAG: ABC transporter permease [Patescibacteria group bacterium]|nr:ABC transporter permease [Patescibacteria group bacterium]